MDAVESIGVGISQPGGNTATDISALGGELGVAKVLGHQLVPHTGHPLHLHAPVLSMVGEPEAGQGWRDHIEGVGRIAAVAGWVGQQGNDLGHLEEATWPAVGDDQRYGIRALAFLVDEVDIQTVHLGLEVAEGVELGFLGAPVELSPPMLDQFFQVGQVAAVVPSGVGNLIGPAGVGQALLQVLQDTVFHGDGKRSDIH